VAYLLETFVEALKHRSISGSMSIASF